jgi:Phage tail sheath protein subtilisin-like domain
MPELVLPGVYIEVRPEALIVPGPISVGNIGIVGTARKGPVKTPVILSSYADAVENFGPYDAYDPNNAGKELTLVRALELAYNNGASTVLAVRVTDGTEVVAKPATQPAGFNVEAKSPGEWGNDITVTIKDKVVTFKLKRGGNTVAEESFGPAKIAALEIAVKRDSALATIKNITTPAADPADLAETAFAGGKNGATGAADFAGGLAALENEDAHIIVTAAQDDAAALKSHVELTSTDKLKRDRIAVFGSKAATSTPPSKAVTSDRVIQVTPGLKVKDAANLPDKPEITLPAAYTAAAIAGMLSARDPHISLTHKSVSVPKLEKKFNSGELEQLVKGQVLALEERNGIRVVRGVTTDDGAFQQITTRRIVDFAKFGVRGAADPFIGLLNNNRVRQALKGSINGFLASMVDDEMLISYELDVTATRDEEIRGIAKVTMTLRPTFSIDFIKVVMFLG